MSKNLTCSRGPLEMETFGEQEPEKFRPPVLPLVENPYLTIARKSLPSVLHDDKDSFIYHHRHWDARYPKGHFTLRHERDFGPSVYESIEEGKTHGLFAVMRRKESAEEDEKMVFLLLVDLREAVRNLALAEMKRSGKSYLCYNVLTPGVWRFCTSIQI